MYQLVESNQKFFKLARYEFYGQYIVFGDVQLSLSLLDPLKEPLREIGMLSLEFDQMLEHGDLDGLAVWKRVGAPVEELLNKEMPPGCRPQ